MSHDPHHDAVHHDGAHTEVALPHASMRDYAIGFVLSVVLTAVPFALVMAAPLSAGLTVAVVLACAVVQIVVHMVYFLHMNPRSEGGWNMLALIFTTVFVVIILAGSLWVMYHMNANMMPMSPHEARIQP